MHIPKGRFKATLFSLITMLILSPILGSSTTHATAAWLTGWTNRVPVTVRNTGTTNLSNYQVKITLPSSFDYATPQPSGADIRVTDNDGLTQLHYWVEQFNPTAHSGTIWATVPAIAAGASDTIYVYYGNPTATSQSNGSATFPMFSNFNNPAWQSLPNMPITTADETVAQVNGIFYIIGGYNNSASDPLDSNYAFDPTTNTYTQKAPMLTKRWGPIAATVNNKIYVFGGQNTSGGSTANEMYDPTTNAWTAKAPLPVSMGNQGITGCTDGTNIYLLYNSAFYVYSPATNTYTAKAALPNPILSWATCAYSNGKIYVINGYSGGATNYTQIYSIATDSWSQGAPSPFATYGSLRESPVIGDNIYIIQGQQTDAEFTSAAYQYSMSTDTWTEKSFGPHAADGVAGGVYNGKIYTFGGRQDWTGPYGLPFAASYDPSADTEQGWYQMYGNFEADQTGLHRMVPLKGTIANGPILSQIQSNYQAGSSFVVEEQTTQTQAQSWNTMAVDANDGYYNNDLNGYLAPYNDEGLTPNETSFYNETGTNYTKLGTSAMATGSERFKVVNSPSSVSLYRNGTLLSKTTDKTYRGGHVDLITSYGNTSTVNFIFVRQYAAVEPTVTVGYAQTNPTNLATCPCSIWPATAAPAASATTNTDPYELGTRFYSEVPGTITALRFYKEPNMAASHTGHLWDNNGNLLASVTFSNESASGWQQATLTTPITITADTPYVVSYHISGGPYAYTQSQFANQTLGTAPLHAYQDGYIGPNGIFNNGDTITFPQGTWSSANYWTDVVFANQ